MLYNEYSCVNSVTTAFWKQFRGDFFRLRRVDNQRLFKFPLNQLAKSENSYQSLTIIRTSHASSVACKLSEANVLF